jgi:hypothetical protein
MGEKSSLKKLCVLGGPGAFARKRVEGGQIQRGASSSVKRLVALKESGIEPFIGYKVDVGYRFFIAKTPRRED